MAFLDTQGLNTLWTKIKNTFIKQSDIEQTTEISIDSSPTAGSTNLVTSGGVKTAVDAKYSKPSGGIPASDMTSGVQTSLGKADTALQSVPNTYRTASAQDVIDAKHVSVESQTLTDVQKSQARTNIGAGTIISENIETVTDAGLDADTLGGHDSSYFQTALDAYLKNASISGNTLTLTKKDDSTVAFTPSGGEGEYELIEKIIIGYSITTSEPSDWSTNYTDYFTNTGTAKEPVYTAVTGATAPTWVVGTYYSYDANGAHFIRRSETDGTPYKFKKVKVFCYMPNASANYRGIIAQINANDIYSEQYMFNWFDGNGSNATYNTTEWEIGDVWWKFNYQYNQWGFNFGDIKSGAYYKMNAYPNLLIKDIYPQYRHFKSVKSHTGYGVYPSNSVIEIYAVRKD